MKAKLNLLRSGTLLAAVTAGFGQPGTTSYADTDAATSAPLFYRVGVGN